MIISTGLRGKVERLLKGDVRQTDLHDIFFQMRDETGGSGLVGEIANFTAHPLRTQGLVWSDVNDATAFLRFRIPLDINQIVTLSLPASVCDIVRRNLRRARKSTLVRVLRMSQQQAEAILEQVLSRVKHTSPDRIMIGTRSDDERRVVSFAFSFFKGGPLFNEYDLFEDLCRALQRADALLPSEKTALKKTRAAISIFAMTTMHNRKIDLGDDTVASISIFKDMRGNLGCFAGAEVYKYPAGPTGTTFAWIFETRLPPSEHCDPTIVPLERAPFLGDYELSFSESGKAQLVLKT